MVATANAPVGGRDFDLALRDFMVSEFKNQTKEDISQSARPLLKIETECEKLKKQMSANRVVSWVKHARSRLGLLIGLVRIETSRQHRMPAQRSRPSLFDGSVSRHVSSTFHAPSRPPS
jgi:molecular chaperone DnaK (HSP70)